VPEAIALIASLNNMAVMNPFTQVPAPDYTQNRHVDHSCFPHLMPQVRQCLHVGQFSVQIPRFSGSALGANQQTMKRALLLIAMLLASMSLSTEFAAAGGLTPRATMGV